MVKLLGYPRRWPSRRRMRTHAAWKVIVHIVLAVRAPRRTWMRSFISAADLLVNVIARICPGRTPRSAMRWAMRWVRTRVLPEPAPATMRSGLPLCVTASRWGPFRPSRSCSWDDTFPRLRATGDVRARGAVRLGPCGAGAVVTTDPASALGWFGPGPCVGPQTWLLGVLHHACVRRL